MDRPSWAFAPFDALRIKVGPFEIGYMVAPLARKTMRP
jgi:hypothetical protein